MLRMAIVVWEESPHFLDHLAPLAIWLGIPLLLPSYRDFDTVRRYYPEADVRFVEGYDLVTEELFRNYDLIFYSTFNRKALGMGKSVFVPHGNSDKAEHLPYFREEEAALIYGQRMLDFIGAPLPHPIVVGNWRRDYRGEPFIVDKTKPVVLYAPSLGGFQKEVLDAPDDYNLLVKLHPRDALENPGLVAQLEGRVTLVHDFPLIYSLLEQVDLYVGDISSIGYDFLAFDRPLVFIGDEPLYSHRFGRVAKPSFIWQEIAEALQTDGVDYREARRAGYDYTFAKTPTKESVYAALRHYYES